jgi:tetratricopeptide (TPR) repeat protein
MTLTGCDYGRYRTGRFYEATKNYVGAVRVYERMIEKNPNGPHAAEVHLRLAEIYACNLERCLEARPHYEAAARLISPGPVFERVRSEIMDCPDYFPLRAGRSWVYGDSASRGKNMRLEWQVSASSSSERGSIVSALYAGSKRIRVEDKPYEKRDWMVFEGPDSSAAPILRFPYRTGQFWTARRGKILLSYRIEEDDARVETAAGTFEHCLKVREFNPKFPRSWTYAYYAPFIGRVKTTVAGPGYENPNTELLRYTPSP